MPDGGFERFIGVFRGVEAEVFEKIFLDDYDGHEVAMELGLTQGRVSQIKGSIDRQIGIEIAREQMDEVKGKCLDLEVDWIKL